MDVPTLEVVVQAIDSLYHSPSKEEKQKANLWLTDLRTTVYVWEIADKLLLLKRDVETSFFAAQTMQYKIRRNFHELPQESHESLKASLMNHLEQLCDAPSPVLRQLAMALVDLLIQMTDCSTIVRDVVSRYGGKEPTACVMLDVLTLLPEEIHNRGLRLGQKRRKELTQAFGREWLLVLELLLAYLSSLPHNNEVTYRIYACLGSWLQMGNFPVEVIQQTSIIEYLFQVLHRLEVPEKVYESATDCVCSAIFVCENDSYRSFALYLQRKVVELQPLFSAAVQQEDYIRAQSLSRIFIEMADTFLYHIAHHTTVELGSLVSLDLLLNCVSHPDYEIVGSTFNVWYRLAEELSKIDDSDLNKVFQPYIQKLISELCKHCQIDEDTSTTSVITDDSDDFTTFRANVVELIKDVNFILGPKSLFEELYMTSCKPGVAWNVKEASLLIMYAVASSLKVDENEVLPIALPVLLSIPPDTHYAIRATTLRLVGELASWIDHHPDVLDIVFTFTEAGLKIPALANAAATAVQCVCLKCKDRLGQRMAGLLEVVQVAYQVGINNDTMLGLLKGIVEVVTRQPAENMNAYLEFVCAPPYQHLLSIVSESNFPSNISRGSSADPCVWLDRLSTIFRSSVLQLNNGELHPCTAVLTSCLPLVVKVCYTYKHETRIVERSCRCMRFMLRTFGHGTAPLVQILIDMCLAIYQEYKHSCFLYLGSIIVDEFGSNSEYESTLIMFMEHMATATFPLLASDNGLLHHPDTVDDVFRMCARYLQRCPIPFLKSAVYPVAKECALAALTLNHRDAYASVMKFFRDLLSMTNNLAGGAEKELLKASIDDFLNSRGVTLMDGLLTGFVYLPSVMISDSAEVLWAMISYAREPIVVALAGSVERLECGKAEVTLEQKEQFVTSVSRCQSVDELHGYIREYSRLYR